MFVGFFVGVISSIVGAVIIYILSRVFIFSRFLTLRGRLLSANKGKVTIYIPSIENINEQWTGKFQNLSSVPLGDAMALDKICNYLSYAKRPYVIHPGANYKYENSGNDVICIGGPRHNQASREILNHLGSRIHYQFARMITKGYESDGIDLKRFVDQKNNGSSILVPIDLETDYGTIISAKKHPEDSNRILIIAGMSPLSTWGAVQWMMNGSHLSQLFKRLSAIQFMIKCSYKDEFNIQNMNLVSVHKVD